MIFPYFAYATIPFSKGSVLAMIIVSTAFVLFFVGSNNSVRFWISTHNIYFFYLFLNGFIFLILSYYFIFLLLFIKIFVYFVGSNKIIPLRQLFEFVIAAFICIISNLIPFPCFLRQKVM